MQSSAQDASPASNSGAEGDTRAHWIYPVALAATAWAGVFLWLVARPIATSVAGLGALVFLPALFLAGRVADKSRLDSVDLDRRFHVVAWLGVGSFPLFVTALALSPGKDSGWLVGAVATFWLIAATIASLPLTRSRSRLKKLRAGFLAFSRFPDAIACRQLAAKDPVVLAARRRRREYALAIESVFTLLAMVIAAFSGLLTFLAARHYGVHLGEGKVSSEAASRAASGYVAWHVLDLVPVLDVPKTLNWKLEHSFEKNYAVGAVLLALKIFIVVPILGAAATLWRWRDTETDDD